LLWGSGICGQRLALRIETHVEVENNNPKTLWAEILIYGMLTGDERTVLWRR
jgi:hypothetical protein